LRTDYRGERWSADRGERRGRGFSSVGTSQTGLRAGRGAGAGGGTERQARHAELREAMRKIDRHGGESRPPHLYGGREPNAGGGAVPAVERGVPAQGAEIPGAAGRPAERGRGQEIIAGVPETCAERRAAGKRGDASRFLGGLPAGAGPSGLAERRLLPGDPADAGSQRRSAEAREPALRQAGFLLRHMGARLSGLGGCAGAGDGVPADSALTRTT
jgi:hypothetical protein